MKQSNLQKTQNQIREKFLKQGVFRFKINNVTFQIDIDSPLKDSQGNKPGPKK